VVVAYLLAYYLTPLAKFLMAMKKKVKQVFELLKRSVKKFKKDNPLQLAGTTAFFAVFAMAPLIIIIVSVAGILLGQEEIQTKVFAEIEYPSDEPILSWI
jgi:uncharacterized BrkB/YihY/UPF0761 family membrane protein